MRLGWQRTSVCRYAVGTLQSDWHRIFSSKITFVEKFFRRKPKNWKRLGRRTFSSKIFFVEIFFVENFFRRKNDLSRRIEWTGFENFDFSFTSKLLVWLLLMLWKQYLIQSEGRQSNFSGKTYEKQKQTSNIFIQSIIM